MGEEIHIAECGAWLGKAHCGRRETRVSERLATNWLMGHLREAHGNPTDPNNPSEAVMGWVYPLPVRRKSWGKLDGDPTEV